jgi:hypothetical protein
MVKAIIFKDFKKYPLAVFALDSSSVNVDLS